MGCKRHRPTQVENRPVTTLHLHQLFASQPKKGGKTGAPKLEPKKGGETFLGQDQKSVGHDHLSKLNVQSDVMAQHQLVQSRDMKVQCHFKKTRSQPAIAP